MTTVKISELRHTPFRVRITAESMLIAVKLARDVAHPTSRSGAGGRWRRRVRLKAGLRRRIEQLLLALLVLLQRLLGLLIVHLGLLNLGIQLRLSLGVFRGLVRRQGLGRDRNNHEEQRQHRNGGKAGFHHLYISANAAKLSMLRGL